MTVIATYLRDVNPRDLTNPRFAGQDVEMAEADAAKLAARQIVSISSMKGDPEAPHRVAALIPAENRPVASIAITPSTVSVAVGASATLTATATYVDGGTGVISDLTAFTSSDTSKVTVTKVGTDIKVNGIAAGTAVVTVKSRDGKVQTKNVTVTA